MFSQTAPRLASVALRTTFRRATTTAAPGPTAAAPAAAAVQAAEARGPLPPLESYAEVPEYYIERGEALKSDDPAHTDALRAASLMNDLHAATLHPASDATGAIRAHMKIREAKVPTEHATEEGDLVHASGFVVPTPEGYEGAVSEEARAWDVGVISAHLANRPKEEGLMFDSHASTQRLQGKVPFEYEHVEGEVIHPSGFAPPAPENKFAEAFHSDHRVRRRGDA